MPATAQRARTSTFPGRSISWPGGPKELQPGTVLRQTKISNRNADFPDTLDDFDHFGASCALLGDLDGDGTVEVAVGAPVDIPSSQSLPGPGFGAVWIFSLDALGVVQAAHKIPCENGTNTGAFGEEFGSSVTALGDLDGDGTVDLAVGARGDDAGGGDRGAVFVLFLRPDGSVRARQKISQNSGGFGGHLDNLDLFGTGVAALGDLDGDGVGDLAVGATGDDDGGGNAGAIWVLFLNSDGTVRSQTKISATSGGFSGTLAGDSLGKGLTGLGDLDGDGVCDLAVGAPGADGSLGGQGAVWILFLNPDGTVRAQTKIADSTGGFGGTSAFNEQFGAGLALLGDLDGDGVQDLAIGAPGDRDGGSGGSDFRGALWVVRLATDGTVLGEQKVSLTEGGFGGLLGANAIFGSALASLGDLDGDGRDELLVGAPETGTTQGRGAAWVLSLTSAGTVTAQHRIRDGESGFAPSTLEPSSSFGHSLTALGDLDGDGIGDVAVGAVLPSLISGPGSPMGVWVLRLTSSGGVKAYQKIDDHEGGLPAGALANYFDFGISLAGIGDLDGDGVGDLAVGALDVGGGGGTNSRLGVVFVLFLEPDGTVRDYRTIVLPRALLREGDDVGRGLASLGDLDGDGVVDLIAGAPGDDDGPPGSDNTGSVWVLFLNADGTLKTFQKISPTEGGFTGLPGFRAEFGDAVAALGDVDGDGVTDVAVGAGFEDDGGVDRGAVYLLFLHPDGTVKGHVKIGSSEGFPGLLDGGRFGASLAGPGDLDGNGVRDLVVGGWGLSDDSVRVLFLNANGTVDHHERISRGVGGFTGELDPFDFFGESVAALGDLDGDGALDIGVGARGDDDGGAQHGAIWLLNLDGFACIDFSTRDDGARTPLVNGRAVASPVGFGRTIELTGTGANLGPAIFDSTPGGPNDPSQDRDLLVGLGNVLILQNSQVPTQTVPGIFDRPNDDQDGGILTFRFAQGPVEPLRLDLIDIDQGSNQMASVQLFDVVGRTRTWSIPAGWTEDLITHGQPAYRTLDLTRLDPQPGFQATATASEVPGFDPRAVVRLEVALGSSGAVDNLCWLPHPE